MRRMTLRRPTPAMIVAMVALVAAFAGESIADVATKALTKKEKKQTKKIATNKANQAIGERAPGLSVANAANAANATNAQNAANAQNAVGAGSVDGQSVFWWDEKVVGQGPPVNRYLGRIGELEFNLRCDGGVGAKLQARADGGDGVYSEEGEGSTPVGSSYVDVATRGQAESVLTRGFLTTADPGSGPVNTMVKGTWRLQAEGVLPGTTVCAVRGIAIGS